MAKLKGISVANQKEVSVGKGTMIYQLETLLSIHCNNGLMLDISDQDVGATQSPRYIGSTFISDMDAQILDSGAIYISSSK